MERGTVSYVNTKGCPLTCTRGETFPGWKRSLGRCRVPRVRCAQVSSSYHNSSGKSLAPGCRLFQPHPPCPKALPEVIPKQSQSLWVLSWRSQKTHGETRRGTLIPMEEICLNWHLRRVLPAWPSFHVHQEISFFCPLAHLRFLLRDPFLGYERPCRWDSHYDGEKRHALSWYREERSIWFPQCRWGGLTGPTSDWHLCRPRRFPWGADPCHEVSRGSTSRRT